LASAAQNASSGGLLGSNGGSGGLGSLLSDARGGALAAGTMGLLLANKKVHKVGDIVSVMLVDEESFMAKSYLDELACQLNLEPGLKAELEKQVWQAMT
jgi:uncharacterized membrane protein YebE (DUF533 family)